ncbi:MAG: hypothetical protein K9J17_15930 [Flavobacteriales bacterium]|nr:hypothetical protein [Flavobacteriales bacterium]
MKTTPKHQPTELPRSSRHLDFNHLLKVWWATHASEQTSDDPHHQNSSGKNGSHQRGVP